MVSIDDIAPYPANAKIHTPEQIEQIAESITEHGFTNPISVDGDMVIIAGHGRHAAAEMLNMPKVPITVIDWLTPTQVAKLRLVDNRLAELSDWDPMLLASELVDLGNVDEKFSPDNIAFDDAFLNKLGIGTGGEEATTEGTTGTDTTEHLLVIDCEGETQQQELYEELHERGLSVKIME